MTLLWASLAIVFLLAGAWQNNIHLCLAAAPFIAITLGLALSRPPQIAGHLDEGGLVLTHPPIAIPYDSIESVTMKGKIQDANGTLQSGPISVSHRAGTLLIPPQLNMPINDLYRYLLVQSDTSGSREVPDRLREFYAKEVESFGVDRVWSFRARRNLYNLPGNWRRRACFAFLLLAGLVWIVAAVMLQRPGRDESIVWGVYGGLLVVVGLIGSLVSNPMNRRLAKQIPKWQEAAIVIAPSGIGMVQGDIQGQLRWDELRDVRLGRPPRFVLSDTRANMSGGLDLIVAGAVIRVCDLYDRPLPVIAKMIRQYWGQPVKV